MYKITVIISAVLFLTSCFISPVYAGKLWDESCHCWKETDQKIRTVTPKREITGDELRRKFQEDSRSINQEAERKNQEYLEHTFTPEERERLKSTYKSKNYNVLPFKSYCAGYAKVKIEQHNNQYYKDMFYFYDSRISETDLMLEKVDREEFLQGYDMKDDDKTLACVEEFEKERGF